MKNIYINECIRASIEALELAKLVNDLNSKNYNDSIKFLKLYTTDNTRENIIDYIEKLILEIEGRFKD